MIQNNEIQDQQTAEPLAVVEPQLNQEQLQADTEVVQQPTEPLDVGQGEQVASLSSWAARNINAKQFCKRRYCTRPIWR